MKHLQSITEQGTYWLKVISLGLILGLGIQFAQAWTNPTTTAPGSNVSGPITTGSGSQTKASGDVSLSGGGSLYSGGVVAAPWLCIGGDCRSAWPVSGGSDNLGNHIATQALNMGANSIISGGSNGGAYGAITLQGSKNGWSGINFRDVNGSSAGTLMMYPSYSGFYSAGDSGWRWYVGNGGDSWQPGGARAADFCLNNGTKCLSSAGGSESDPTVPAYIKDGTDWSEVTNKPADMSPPGTICGMKSSISSAVDVLCKGVDFYRSGCPSGYNSGATILTQGMDTIGFSYCVKQ